jgi:hypothetical protein
MSEKYKEYIDKLCEKADNGSIKASKELLYEANNWSAKIKELDNKRNNKTND